MKSSSETAVCFCSQSSNVNPAKALVSLSLTSAHVPVRCRESFRRSSFSRRQTGLDVNIILRRQFFSWANL